MRWLVMIYVDDLPIASNSISAMRKTTSQVPTKREVPNQRLNTNGVLLWHRCLISKSNGTYSPSFTKEVAGRHIEEIRHGRLQTHSYNLGKQFRVNLHSSWNEWLQVNLHGS